MPGKYKDTNYMKKYRAKNKNKIDESQKKYKEVNKKRLRAIRLKWERKNRIKILEKSRKYGMELRKNHPEKIKALRLKYTYGITMPDYKSLLEKQNGVCAICLKKETHKDKRSKKIRALAVDHDHKNGKVRGLLCSRCNRALGSFEDSIKFLSRAIRYLRRDR